MYDTITPTDFRRFRRADLYGRIDFAEEGRKVAKAPRMRRSRRTMIARPFLLNLSCYHDDKKRHEGTRAA
jgi:hypothetical protein